MPLYTGRRPYNVESGGLLVAAEANAGEDGMSMDFETVRFLRILFALVFACVGVAAGFKYFGLLGSASAISSVGTLSISSRDAPGSETDPLTDTPA